MILSITVPTKKHQNTHGNKQYILTSTLKYFLYIFRRKLSKAISTAIIFIRYYTLRVKYSRSKLSGFEYVLYILMLPRV